MPKFTPIPCPTGTRFGRWTVIGPREGVGRKQRIACSCDCGSTRLVSVDSLRRGGSTSCGCWKGAKCSASTRKHGGCRIPEYQSWGHLKRRCLNPTDAAYDHYGGRGITVCERWQGPDGFANFYADMGPRPSPKHSIDRIDNNGPYSPENCRWATSSEQGRNTRGNRFLTFEDRTQCLQDWSDEIGIDSSILSTRLRRGWPVEDALTRPVSRSRAGIRWRRKMAETRL